MGLLILKVGLLTRGFSLAAKYSSADMTFGGEERVRMIQIRAIRRRASLFPGLRLDCSRLRRTRFDLFL